MTIDITKLNPDVLHNVRMALDCEDPTDTAADDDIAGMTPKEVLERFLQWEGILGYTERLWNAVESIKAAAEKGDEDQ